ncbi:MAG: hypothetical protein ACREOF_15985, partial [Gemmatimonadales bacterium]
STRAQAEDAFSQPPAPAELLARFIFPKNHFSRKTSRPKPDAFLPQGSPLQASVFRTQGLSERRVWEIGLAIGTQRHRTLRARADVSAGSVTEVGLLIDPDNTPRRHANIVGWPSEKHEQLMFATELAEAATLHIRPGQSAT